MHQQKARILQVALASLLVLAGTGTGWLYAPREYRTDPPVSASLAGSPLMPAGISGAPAEIYFAMNEPFQKDAYQLSQGKRLYDWFGCRDCHGDGRGGTGPSFLDGWWLYGPEMVSIAASIRNGRPHGMPSFRDRMTEDQIWQLSGYVQTIGAYKVRNAAPGRNDDRYTRPAENRGPALMEFHEEPDTVNEDQGPRP